MLLIHNNGLLTVQDTRTLIVANHVRSIELRHYQWPCSTEASRSRMVL